MCITSWSLFHKIEYQLSVFCEKKLYHLVTFSCLLTSIWISISRMAMQSETICNILEVSIILWTIYRYSSLVGRIMEEYTSAPWCQSFWK